MISNEVSMNSLFIIEEELNIELNLAQQWLEYLQVKPNAEYQQNLSVSLTRCAGALKMANLSDAALLIESLADTIEHTINTNITWTEEIVNTLAYPLFLIPRYIHWVQEYRFKGGPLLLDAINNLRQIGADKSLVESSLLDVSIPLRNNPFAGLANSPVPDMKPHLAKLLPLFNKARKVVKAKPEAALDLLNKIAKQLQKLTGNAPIAELFWLFGAVIEAMQVGDLRITKQRQQWLLLVEQQLNMLYKQPDDMLKQSLNQGIKKEFLALLALSSSSNEHVKKIVKLYHLPQIAFSDRDIAKGLAQFKGIASDTYMSIYLCIHENIENLRPALEQLLDGYNLKGEDVHKIKLAMQEIVAAVTLTGIASTQQLANQCQQLVDQIIQQPSVDLVNQLSSLLLYLPERFYILGESSMSIQEKHALLVLEDEELLGRHIHQQAIDVVMNDCDERVGAIEQKLEVAMLQSSLNNIEKSLTDVVDIKSKLALLNTEHISIAACEALEKSLHIYATSGEPDLSSIPDQLIALRYSLANNSSQSLH